MLGDKRLIDDMARVASGAASAIGGFRSRLEEEFRDQAERLLLKMNLVTREEHDVVAALAAKARAEQEALAERVAALEAALKSRQRKRPEGAVTASARRPAADKTPRTRRPRGQI
jgi:BMFP domain-containing protein YqiC